MSEADPKSPTIKPRSADQRRTREARLAEEMRANLLKRKAQRVGQERPLRPDDMADDDQPA
ncbi:MAG: hypothetical protein R3349_04800 [Geminicoccaceae bacterium]|nr:hypothetical protein [Geminicoccaceae bacterium]